MTMHVGIQMYYCAWILYHIYEYIHRFISKVPICLQRGLSIQTKMFVVF